MKSYYRPNVNAHQAGYHRARRRRRVLALARYGGFALAFGAAVVLGSAAWAAHGSGWVRAQLSALQLLRIETLQVGGMQTLTRDAVIAAAGVRIGESLAGLDLEAVRTRLVGHPWIRTASVRRRLPGTLVVDVEERVPWVVVRADRDYLVDAEGVVVEQTAPGVRPDLPVLTGVEAVAGALTARGVADLADGIELVAALRQVGFPALSAIDHIDLADPEDAVIVPVAGRPLVHTGRRDVVGRLRRWHLVAPDMAQRWPELEYVELRAGGQVVALPAAAEPQPPAEKEPAVLPPGARERGRGAGAATGRVKAGDGHA